VSVRMTTDPQQFPASIRLLHWLMASMVASLTDYHRPVSIHRPAYPARTSAMMQATGENR
jgi:cytochrome b561